MIEIWSVLTPILIADVLNPVLFTFLVYAAGSNRPVANSSAALLGHTMAYFTAGLVLAPGLEKISQRLVNPELIDFLIELIVGLLLLWVAFLSMKGTSKDQKQDRGNITPLKAIGFGAIINFIGIPFALPYFAAIDQILKADLSTYVSLLILVVYNLFYALPFSIVPILCIVLGEQSRPILRRINDWMDRISSVLMPLLLFLVGLAMAVDSIYFFTTGRVLF